MTLRAQIILITALVIVLFVIFNMVRKRKLELKYALAWLLCDIALIIIVCIPKLLDVLAALLGIQSPMNLVFFLGFIFALVFIFILTVSLSRVTAKVRRLAQMEALLRKELMEKEKETNEDTENSVH